MVEQFSCVHIVAAVVDGGLQFLLSQSAVDVEIDLSLLDGDTKVGFKSLEGQTVLTVIHEVETMEEHSVVLQLRNVPSIDLLHDDQVVYLLDLFRGVAYHHCLEDVVIVVLIIEATQEGVLLHERKHRIIVVVDDRPLPGCYFFEDE